MRLPTQLSRRKKNVHKNDFGHVLIIAGSRNMVGAACISGYAAIRSGAGLVTVAIPESLNTVVQKKMSPTLMTLPLKETKEKTIAPQAYEQIKKQLKSFTAIAIGPGLSQNANTQKFIYKIVANTTQPIVIDADALNALAKDKSSLLKNKSIKILTPHPGEMARLTKLKKSFIEKNRKKVSIDFAKKYKCTLLLKGHQTVIASKSGKTSINKTGNPGMATAGSGDVLTGMIASFLAQGLNDFESAKFGAYIHGKAGDLAAKKKTRLSMIATDITDEIPKAVSLAKR